MIKKRYKLKELEKHRFSIITTDLQHCIICKSSGVDINEIFMGRNRLNSIKYGMCIPLCRKHHTQYHNDRNMQLYWMNKGKDIFINTYSQELWNTTFRYIKG